MKSQITQPAKPATPHPSGSTIRLTLSGLVILCVSLIAASGIATHMLGSRVAAEIKQEQTEKVGPKDATGENADMVGPWGDLITLDIDIEQPVEYVSFENTTNRMTTWVFPGSSQHQARTMMLDSGMTAEQADAAMAEGKVETTPEATIVKPDDQLVLSLTPDVRGKFYAVLARWPENKLMAEPYHLQDNKFEVLFAKNGVEPSVIAKIKNLAYSRGGNFFFSDPEVVMHGIATEEGRVNLMKSLTYQTAVLARMRLRHDTDIDKMLGYWGTVPGIRDKDLRPLLDSIKDSPQGGTISLLYFLPQFARERLFTFPLPSKPGDPKMDCHWTALNFFSEKPDDRFQDNAYASKYIQDNFYQIGKPSMCGDLVFLLDDKGAVIHSAVYIAGDIVFTKNGANYAQPWLLMRMNNLLKVYTFAAEPKAVYYRRKQD